MKTQSRKAKGRILQNWVRDKLYSLHSGLKPGDVESRSMGANGEDIMLSPKARRKFPFSFECKNIAKSAVYNYMRQAQDNCPKGAEPIVVLKANRQKPVVVVDAEYFLENFNVK